ncbi:hypothetical protein Q3G72_031079 [Acer saccharum]|nr:hypothetical protein Q3G72_031079 [Acer saccharum]
MEGIARTMELQVEQIVGSQQQMEFGRLSSQTEQANALTILRSEAGTRKEPEVVQKDTSRMHKSSNPYVPPSLIPHEQNFKETYEVLSEVDISLPLFETMTLLGKTAEFDVFESTKHLIEIFECFGIQDENLEDEHRLASGYFRKSTHVELEDLPTPLVERDSARIEDMVTKLKEDHQVLVGMNLELTTKLDEVCNMLHEVWENFGPNLSITKSPQIHTARQSPPSSKRELAGKSTRSVRGINPTDQKPPNSRDSEKKIAALVLRDISRREKELNPRKLSALFP